MTRGPTLDRSSRDIDGYLARLGVEAIAADLATLRRLHRAHLEAVPFENGDVLRGEPIELRDDLLVRRLANGRGGFCYQLNGAFAALLESLGFAVERLPARFHGSNGMEPRFGHLTLRVTLEEPWLVDVGGGYSFSEPLRLDPGLEQDDPSGRFRIVHAEPADDDGPRVFDVEWQHRDGAFRPHFRFEPTDRALAAFAPTCEWTRTSRDSPFTGGWVCARRLEDGWATLDDRKLIVSRGPERAESTLNDAALATALERWFGVTTGSADARSPAPT